MTVVIDTSVAVAWYLNEAFSPEARRWQDRILQGHNHAIVRCSRPNDRRLPGS